MRVVVSILVYEFIITGIVQGVGFRPFIYNQAIKLGVRGYVQNTGFGVKILCDEKSFIDEIKVRLPLLAKISSISVSDSNEVFVGDKFFIKQSEDISSYSAIPADLNLCDNCLKELFDEGNFRHNYFFISCTNCGPRYSIVEGTPYDRNKTSLKKFELCDVCREEYENPLNRRYHAQTVACSHCGPRLDLYVKGEIFDGDVICKTVELLNEGKIVAIKGVGGFHLVCKGDDDVVKNLKKISKRYRKPFALMGKDIDMIEKFCFVSDKEKEVLLSNQRPIVLLDKKDKKEMRGISELSSLGFMLPYSAVHYLLFKNIDFPLIMTSSNLPSYPITMKREEQFVDYVLDYNRDIVNFVDDSIVKVVSDYLLIIRRSRGFAPNEFSVPDKYKREGSILAVGAEMKNAFCTKKDNKLIVSQHIGNTFNFENFENFRLTVKRFLEFTNVEPKIILQDLNSGFNTSLFAKDFANENSTELVSIQHHIAHGFSVAFEHNLNDFLSIVCDGTGLGDDGKIWGGEVFHNDVRIGRLEYQDLIGGDIANKEVKRVLAGVLSKFLYDDVVIDLIGDNSKVWLKQKNENFNCIKSSSCGRVLDCVSALLGYSSQNFYEGRGAMLLESNSVKCELFFSPKISKDENGLFVLDTTCLIKFIYENLGEIDKEKLAYFAQMYLAKGLFKIAKLYNDKLPICFSGGVAYNKYMSGFMLRNGVLLNKEVPCGDGGIAVGQIAYYLWKK